MRTASLIVATIAFALSGCAASSKTAQSEPAQTVVTIPLQYRDAISVATQFRPEVMGRTPVKVTADTYTTSVIVAGSPDTVAQVQQKIAEIDIEG